MEGAVSMVLSLFLAAGAWASPETVSLRQIGPGEVAKMQIEGKAFELVDVRPAEQYRKRHLVGARSVPFSEIGRVSLPHDRLIVLYCSAVSCSLSSDSARVLMERGYHQVSVLEGGMEAGLAAGLVEEGQGGEPSAPARRVISCAALQEKLAACATCLLLLDVRTSLEFKAGHIPGARNIPLESLRQSPAVGPGPELVVYDRNSQRAAAAAILLRARALEARELDGGLSLWSHEQRPLQSEP